MCTPHQILASLALLKLPLSHVYGIAGSEALRGVSASKVRSSLNFAVDLAIRALLRGILPKSCL